MANRFEQLKSDMNIIITCICLKTNNGTIFLPKFIYLSLGNPMHCDCALKRSSLSLVRV